MVYKFDKYTRSILSTTFCFFVFISCSSNAPEHKPSPLRQVAALEIPSNSSSLELPSIISDKGELTTALRTSLKKIGKEMPEDEFNLAVERLRKYFLFLGLSAKDFKKAAKTSSEISIDGKITVIQTPVNLAPIDAEESSEDEEIDNTPSNLKAIQRLFIASTQFLECYNLTDWACLEKNPKLKPNADFRISSNAELGTPIMAGESLDMDVFFTKAWDGSPSGQVAKRFAERLQKDVGKSLSIAMYGIDDIKGSMSEVYNSIANHARSSVDVRSVIDISGFEKGTAWVFNYVRPLEKTYNLENWLFGPSKNGPGMHATFQYDGSPDFINLMNEGIKIQEESRVRIEWPSSHIMHNKFAVLENNDGLKSVWTGTANISKNCMGVEANSNMSVYIRNDFIAEAFLDQFNLMFNFDPLLPVRSKLVVNADEANPALIGHFHRNKYPISHRFFKFNDGTNLRVHFAPTDDAEHRVILPMLLSAKAGDIIRISMFGGTGYEIVRAMQYAVAKGANVRIVFDARLGHGLTSWIRDRILNVFMKNPYLSIVQRPKGVKAGAISVRSSTWKGKNHYKVGTLTRKQPDGSMKAEEIILGSQNWSSGGNDDNDENLISIQNLTNDVPAAKLFNQEFDGHLWIKSREEKPRIL